METDTTQSDQKAFEEKYIIHAKLYFKNDLLLSRVRFFVRK